MMKMKSEECRMKKQRSAAKGKANRLAHTLLLIAIYFMASMTPAIAQQNSDRISLGFGCLSLRWKELQNKENPCKLILYGDFLFLVHSKNKHIKAFFRCTIRCTCLPSMSGTPIK